MASKKGITAAVVLLLLAGGKKAAAAVPDEPEPEPPEGPGPGFAPPPVLPLPPVGPAADLPAVWASQMRATPTPGFGYQVKQGEVLRGNNGIMARAMTAGGMAGGGSGQDRTAYLRAITRVRSNWRLYGTPSTGFTPAIDRVQILNQDDSIVSGTIGAAFVKMHDNWAAATTQGSLPSRLIGWTRNPNTGAPRTAANWQARMHGPSRTFGVLLLPDLACVLLGLQVGRTPNCDWAAQLYNAAGTAWAAWVPE